MSDSKELFMVNGDVVSAHDIMPNLFSSALFYGTGCFETMRFENGQIVRFEKHMQRLNSGLEYLDLPGHLYPEKESLNEIVTQLVNKHGLGDKTVKIRVQCSLLEQNGYRFDSDVQLLTHIKVGAIKKNIYPLRLLTAKTRVIPSECRPASLKLSNMLHYRSAFREAAKDNYDEALMLTLDGNIAETSMANIFWFIGEKVFTPSRDCSILPGIMRSTTIDVIKKSLNLELEEGFFKRESLLLADLVWLSNSVNEIQPVISIDEFSLNCDEIRLRNITSAIHDYNWGKSST